MLKQLLHRRHQQQKWNEIHQCHLFELTELRDELWQFKGSYIPFYFISCCKTTVPMQCALLVR